MLSCAVVRAARFDTVVTLDDDLNNPPEEIPTLLARMADGFDVVYGAPQQLHHGFLRDMASRATKVALHSVMGAETASHVSTFRAFRTGIRESFRDYSGPFVSIDVLLTWGTSSFTYVTVRHDPRAHGRSNYSTRKLITHAVNMITGFSVVPLQVASVLGFVFSLFGLAVLCYVIGSFIVQGGSLPGFPFLASLIAIFAGVQLFSIGIIREYLARMHVRAMGRPSYHIADVTPASLSPESMPTAAGADDRGDDDAMGGLR